LVGGGVVHQQNFLGGIRLAYDGVKTRTKKPLGIIRRYDIETKGSGEPGIGKRYSKRASNAKSTKAKKWPPDVVSRSGADGPATLRDSKVNRSSEPRDTGLLQILIVDMQNSRFKSPKVMI
jgi:hypothetical protein